MGFQQDTIIYIDDQDKLDASVAANAFADKDVKNRAYVNTLGAELAMKYLASENINVSDIYNIHSIKKILEELDISDVMLPNIHIDVRVVFDDNAIFIPKSHFKYNLEPDIYLVFNLAKDFSHVKFLGFFEPKLINKNNQNEDYYFIEKEKLNPVSNLKNYIENFKGNTTSGASQEDIDNSERIIMAMADNDISEDEKQYLIKQLTKSAELRDKFIEYENFETLSYKAMTDPQIKRKEIEEIENNNEKTIENHVATDLNAALQDLGQTSENIDVLDSIEDFENLDLAPVDGDLEDLTINNTIDLAPENNENKQETETKDNNLLENIADIGTAAATGAVAGAAAGAAGSAIAGATDSIANAAEVITGTTEAVTNIAQTVGDVTGAIADTVENEKDLKAEDTIDNSLDIVNSDIELSKDLIKNKTEAPEPITFDNIDTSELDNLEAKSSDDNFTDDETISFDNIDIDTASNKTDFIDQIDNKISFDDVATTDNEESNTDVDETIQNEQDSISLENIDTSLIDDSNTISNLEDTQPIVLDDIDTSNITDDLNINADSNAEDSFDTQTDSEIDDANATNLDINSSENSVQSDDDLKELNELPETDDGLKLILDDNSAEKEQELNIEPLNNKQKDTQTNDNDDLNFEFLDDDTFDTTAELPETPITNTSSSNGFGKNLLDNMYEENLDNISTDDFNLEETPLSHNVEEITSDELLSQIDDILNINDTSSAQNQSAQQENRSTEYADDSIMPSSEDDLSEIPNIDDLISSPEIDKTPETPVTPISKVQPEILETTDTEDSQHDTDTISNETASDNTNVSTSNEETADTALDELLSLSEDNSEENAENSDYKLGDLFNDTDPTSDPDLDEINPEIVDTNNETPIPGAAFLKPKKQTNKKTLITAAALITIIAGASAFVLLKPKTDSASDIESAAPQSADILDNPNQTADNNENILETNAPTINNTTDKKVQKTKQQVKELKNTAVKKPIPSESYLEVQKLVWDVPDTLSYSPKMQNYLRTAGKSIKLSLSTDLLLASEYAYSNQVKVGLKLSKDGAIQESNIISSSGSTEIDNIVLQSVKDTLNVVKPPSTEISTPDFNLNLIIYF